MLYRIKWPFLVIKWLISWGILYSIFLYIVNVNCVLKSELMECILRHCAVYVIKCVVRIWFQRWLQIVNWQMRCDRILHAHGVSLKTKEKQTRRQRMTGWKSNQNMCTIVCAWLRNGRTARNADIGHVQSTTYCRETNCPSSFIPQRLMRIIWVSLFGFHNAVIKDLCEVHAIYARLHNRLYCTAPQSAVPYCAWVT